MKKKEANQSILFHIALLCALFLPTNNLSHIIIGILPIILYAYNKPISSSKIRRFSLFIILIIVSSFIVNSFTNTLSINVLFRFLSFILLFGLFPFTKSVKISTIIIYVALIYIILSQLAYVWGINPLIAYYDALYPYTGDTLGYQTDYLLKSAGDIESIVNRRYGGLFHNPNQCVRYVTLLFLVFLINSKGDLSFNKKILFVILVYISVLFSGSRTGLVVVTIILLYDLFIFNTARLNFRFISLLFAVSFILVYLFFSLSETGFRVFIITEGNFNSLEAKYNFFNKYFEQIFSPLVFLFGNFSNDNIYINYGLTQLDSEWGELFYNFGILGIISFVMFYYKLWKTKHQKLRFFMFILFWGITSTIIFSFRMSFIFMLLLSNYYSEFLSPKHLSSPDNQTQ